MAFFKKRFVVVCVSSASDKSDKLIFKLSNTSCTLISVRQISVFVPLSLSAAEITVFYSFCPPPNPFLLSCEEALSQASVISFLEAAANSLRQRNTHKGVNRWKPRKERWETEEHVCCVSSSSWSAEEYSLKHAVPRTPAAGLKTDTFLIRSFSFCEFKWCRSASRMVCIFMSMKLFSWKTDTNVLASTVCSFKY